MKKLVENKLYELQTALHEGNLNRCYDIIENLKAAMNHEELMHDIRLQKKVVGETKELMKHAFNFGEERWSKAKFEEKVIKNPITFKRLRDLI